MAEGASTSHNTATAPRRGRRPGNLTSGRTLLLSAAQRHFARLGFEGASLRLIAQDAGVTPALVIRLFGSKQGLYLAVIDHLHLEQQTQLANIKELQTLAPRNPLAALSSWVEMLTTIGPVLGDVPALMMHEAAPEIPGAVKNPEAVQRCEAIDTQLITPFKNASLPIFEQAQKAGILKSSSAQMTFSLLMGAVVSTLLLPRVVPDELRTAADFPQQTAASLLSLVVRHPT